MQTILNTQKKKKKKKYMNHVKAHKTKPKVHSKEPQIQITQKHSFDNKLPENTSTIFSPEPKSLLIIIISVLM
jgi:hypothetical protein